MATSQQDPPPAFPVDSKSTGIQQQQQPSWNPGMSMQPMPYEPPSREKFSHGLCECGVGECCMAWFWYVTSPSHLSEGIDKLMLPRRCSPCIAYGENNVRFEGLKKGEIVPKQSIETCSTPTLVYCLVQYVTGCGAILEFMQRSSVRRHYHMPGSDCNDCLIGVCCTPCSIIQTSHEFDEEEAYIMQKTGGAPAPKAVNV